MTDENSQALFEQAKAAIDLGQRDEAADILKQLVEETPDNIEVWIELAGVLDDPNEKRIALSTILKFDPDNAFAKKALEETEREKVEIVDAEEVVPGITRREVRLIGLGLTAFTIVVFGLVFAVVISGNNQRASQRAELTGIAQDVTATRIAISTTDAQRILEQTEEAMFATQTAVATITPTITPTRTPDLPPTPTETVTPTEVVLRLLPAPPDTVTGSLIIWGGDNPQSDDYLNVFRYAWQGGQITSNERLNSDLVQNPVIDDSGTRLVYLRQVQGGNILYQVNGQSPAQGSIDLGIPQNQLAIANDPDISHNGNFLVYTALSPDTNTNEIFIANLLARDTRQLTNDASNYSSPAVSPDGSLVVAVKDADTNPDLILIQATEQQADTTFPQNAITADGINTVEKTPDFSPDGTQIIFSLHTTNPADNDVYAIRLTGGTQPTPATPILTSGFDERNPVFAPSGGQIAYTTNEAPGGTHVFVFDITSNQSFQITEGTTNFYLGGWSN